MVKVKENMTGWNMWEHGVPDSRLTVIQQVEDYIRPNGQRSAQWLCECNCEQHNFVIVRADQLKNGQIKSCGCLNVEKAKTTCAQTGKLNHKENKYDLSHKYGIGWTGNTNEPFYFDIEDYELIKKYYWRETQNQHGYIRLVAHSRADDDFKNCITMSALLGFKNYDHIDRNPLNNQKSNFRKATNSQQSINRNKLKSNTSGFTGVSWREREKKWCAYVQINGKTKSLGYYNNKQDAIKARLNAEVKYYGEFSAQRHLFEQYKINESEVI